ncbi:hypothetical protein B0H11DRAFT_2021017 [Mycena galericulata]|nr:hypothetical protein B0H11DRAFT_2021017 [Mycena galericulata]
MSTRGPRNSADLDAGVQKGTRVPHTTQDDPALAFVATHKLLGSPIQVQAQDSVRRVGKWAGKRRLAHRTSIALDRPLSPPSPTGDPLLIVSFPPNGRYSYEATEPTTAVPGDIWPSTHVDQRHRYCKDDAGAHEIRPTHARQSGASRRLGGLGYPVAWAWS